MSGLLVTPAGDAQAVNPLAITELKTRADLQAALAQLCAPLRDRASEGGGRIPLGYPMSRFDDTASELEGFARPLWGLVPMAAGGGEVDLELWVRGLANGTDPAHPDFWGVPGDRDQRLVEMAAIGFALALAPDRLWEPLEGRARRRVAAWLGHINTVEMPDNNWLYFRVLVNVGLRRVDQPYDPAAMHAALDRLESFALGDGWYSDGPTARRDHYVAFALHLYGLLYSALAGEDDPARAARLRERAAAYAPDYARWFASDGAVLPFGRSLTYRFAPAGFWGALALAGVEALPWGQLKGLVLRHLRWWSRLPISDDRGVLTVGYAYPNLTSSEHYNSAGSPYWATKAFLPLALGQDHPFWLAEEEAPPGGPEVCDQPHAGMVISRDDDGHVVALAGGQHASWMRHGAEKYAKLAYSTTFAFSVPAARRGLEQGAHDSTLALSVDDGVHWAVREGPSQARILAGHVLSSRWDPWPDVEVETWLAPVGHWHLRYHRITTARVLHTADGGFAVRRGVPGDHTPPTEIVTALGMALACHPAGSCGVLDLDGGRSGEIVQAYPHTNLMAPRTVIPTLRSVLEPGTHLLRTAVLAVADTADVTARWDHPPDGAALEGVDFSRAAISQPAPEVGR